jgi:hypothetical protein
MYAAEYFESYSKTPPPYVQEAVPFGRVRNRKTVEEYDFLLNTTMGRLGNNDGAIDWKYDESMQFDNDEEPQHQNDHATQIFQSVRKSQAMHELSAPRLKFPLEQRIGIGRRRSFDGTVGDNGTNGVGGGIGSKRRSQLPSISNRDDARLLNNAFDSLLTRWSKNVPGQNPRILIKKFVEEGNVQATLNILDPEVRILKATMITLQQQVAGKCIEQANLMDRVDSRYRRTIRVLIQLSQRVQVLRAQVAQKIPQIEEGRNILTDAVKALRLQVEETIKAGDGRVNNSNFQDALKRLAANTSDQPRNPEVRELRKLESAVSDLQQGRIKSDMKVEGIEKELFAVRTGYEEAMDRVAEDMKVLQKTLSSLRRNEGLTKKNRDLRINTAMDEAFQRAQAVAAGSLLRLEKENNNLQNALSQIKRQLTQQHFESNLSSTEIGLQCDIIGEENAAAELAEMKAKEKKEKKDSKKKKFLDKKKKKKKNSKTGKKNDKNVPKAEEEEEEEDDDEDDDNDKIKNDDNPEKDDKMMKMKMNLQKLTHLVLEKEAQIQYLQKMIQDGNSGSGKKNTGTSNQQDSSSSGSNEGHSSLSSDKKNSTKSTQYEENPVASTHIDNGTNEDNKNGKFGGRRGGGKRPRKRQRGSGGGGGVGVEQAAPDSTADIRWARCWMSIACAAAAEPPIDGGLQPGVSFTTIMRREMLKICGTQGFGDLVMCLVVDIVRKRSKDCRLLHLFSILLGMTDVKPMESDDTGFNSKSTEMEEFHAIIINVLSLAQDDKSHHAQDDENGIHDHPGHPLLVPPSSPNYRISLRQTKVTVGKMCSYLGIPKQMAKAYEKAAMAFGEGFPKDNAVDVCDIVNVIDGAWRDQYGRRKVQLGAQYSMASATTNWFNRVDATRALMKLEPTFTQDDADEVYRSAVAMIRQYNVVTSTNSSTKMNPGVNVRTLIPALIRASWCHLKGSPRWVPSPNRIKQGEDLLALVNESMSAMPRHMASLMQKHACKQLRKLLIRMKHELKDAVSSIDEHAIGSLDYCHAVEEHGERLMVLMQEIGSYVCGQDENTVRAALKELTGR